MRFMKWYLFMLMRSVLLAGCGDKLSEVKQAAAGIGSKANEASIAISADVHSIRATELTYKEQTFTINDIFKTILRDVQWHYDKDQETLIVTGTWKDNGLFESLNFDEATKVELQHEGDVQVVLPFLNNELARENAEITLTLNDTTLFDANGQEALYHLFDVYLMK